MSAADTTAISLCIQTGLPPLIESTPGTGKTSLVNKLTETLGRPIKTLIAALHEPADFNGWPSVQDGVMKFFPPEWVQFCVEHPNAVVFFDELTTAPPAVQASLLRVMHERVVGQVQMPETVSLIAACNAAEHAPGGWELALPLANRMIHLEWAPEFQAWADGMTSGWPEPRIPILPKDWKAHLPQAVSLVIAFNQKAAGRFNVVPSDDTKKAFPTPRTWDFAARLIAACTSVGLPYADAVTLKLISGAVGPGVATEFVQYISELDLPDPERLLAKPGDYNYAKLRGDQLYAVLGTVTAAVVQKNTPERWAQGWKVLWHAAQDKPDIACHAGRTLAKNRPSNQTMVPTEARVFADILTQAGILVRRYS